MVELIKKREFKPNCEKVQKEDGTFVICKPTIEEDGHEIPLASREVVFEIKQGVAVLKDDGGMVPDYLEKLDRHLAKFLRR